MGLGSLLNVRFASTMMNLLHMLIAKDIRLNLHVVRMLESSTRFSSLLKEQEHTDLVRSDPLLSVFSTFAHLNGVELTKHVALDSIEHMANEVCNIADRSHLNMILVPYQHPLDASSALNYTATPRQNRDVIRQILKKWNRPVAIVLDRGSEGVHSTSSAKTPSTKSEEVRVLVAFFGGPDDREALRFALRLGNHPNTVIHVLHFESGDAVESISPAELPHEKLESSSRKASQESLMSVKGTTRSPFDSDTSTSDLLDRQLIDAIKTMHQDDALLNTVETTPVHLEDRKGATAATGITSSALRLHYRKIVFADENPMAAFAKEITATDAKSTDYAFVVFGRMGTKWWKMMREGGVPADINTVHHTVHAGTLHDAHNNHRLTSSTIHSLRAFLGAAGHGSHSHSATTPATQLQAPNPTAQSQNSNLRQNEYTVPRIGSEDFSAILSHLTPVGLSAESTATSTHQSGAAAVSPDSLTSIMGELGSFLFMSTKSSLISVRKFHARD